MLIPIADQRPGIELYLLGGRSPYSGIRCRPDAMEVGQGYETRFYDCPAGDPDDVVCIDGVWHWDVTDPSSAE